jgi:signal transduction histidine kinase
VTLRAIPRERVDRIAAVALGAAAAADAGLVQSVGDLPALTVALSFLMCLPLGWRRRFPVAAPALMFALGVAQNLFVASVEDSTVLLFVVLTGCYSAGAYADGRRALTGLAVCLVGMVSVQATFASGFKPGEVVWTCAIVTAAWLAGRTVRTRTRLTEELHEAALHAEEAREAETRAAVADERRRIAREMHDIVAHSVSVMVVQAGGARRILDRDVDRAVEAAERIEDTGRAALLEMRRLLGILSAGEDDAHHAPQPTLEALDALVEGARTAGLPVSLRIEGERRALPPGVDLAAYRVIQEAVTNALKHAGAAPTDVCVRYRDNDVELEVTNNGAGHRSRRHDLAGGGHGLVGMQERVRVFGGELFTGRRRGGGFEVRARIPMHDPLPDRHHQSAGLDAPRGLDRPEADRHHQSAGLDAPRR